MNFSKFLSNFPESEVTEIDRSLYFNKILTLFPNLSHNQIYHLNNLITVEKHLQLYDNNEIKQWDLSGYNTVQFFNRLQFAQV